MRGYWIHHDKEIGYAREGRRRTTIRHNRSCGHLNPYMGRTSTPKVIDVTCRKCGKRVRFNNPRTNPRICKYGYYDGRGSVRQAEFYPRENWSNSQIAKHCMLVNASRVIKNDEGFVTALELAKRKSSRPEGGELDG